MFEDDDIEILEDGEQNTSPSNYSNNVSKKDSENLRNTIEKNKKNLNSRGTSGIDNGNQFKNAGNVANMSKGLNSKDPEEQKEAMKTMGKDAIKPMVRKGVQAATGGLVGTDPVTGKIIDSAVDKVADNPNVDKIIDETVKKVNNVKRKMVLKMLLPMLPGIFAFLMLIVVINYLFLPVFGLGDYDQSKVNKYEKKYYEELDRIGNIYKEKCGTEMNKEIITTSIFYDQMFFNIGEDIEYTDEDNIQFSALDKINYKGKSDDIKKLAEKLYPAFDFDGDESETEEDSEEQTEVNVCLADYPSYQRYLASSYIKNNYKNDIENMTDSEIASEILAMNGEYIITQAFAGSYSCPGVTVTNPDGSLMGTYDLETYVAGVVEAEGYSSVVGIEALKAQAIAARTFVLYQTDNCKQTIESSQKKQVFKEPSGGRAFEAAESTEGLIVRYDDEIMSVMYDSFYTGGDYSCDDNGCSVTYTKLPNHETHTVTVSNKYKYMIAGGHGMGMSQVASYDLADQGYLYDEILYKFYSPGIEISKMGALIQGGLYTSNVEPAANAEVLKQRTSTGTDMFYNSSKGLISQCPWYAKSRASEIIYYSDMPDDLKELAITSISNTTGNGVNVVKNADKEIFEKSYDYTQVRPGSLVSWSDSCHIYGHVAVVEQVNEDGTIVLSDGWNGGGIDAANIWQNIDYNIRTVSLEYMNRHTRSNGCIRNFEGYVYLLG